MAEIDSSALLAAVELAASVREKRSVSPVLQRVHIFGSAGRLFVAGAGYEQRATVELNADVGEAFDAVVEPEYLVPLLRRADGVVLLEAGPGSLRVETDGHHLSLPAMDGRDWPGGPDTQPRTETATVSATIWDQVGSLVAYAASRDEFRPALQAICLRHYDGEGLAAMATDGYRLAEYVFPGLSLATGTGDILLPATAIATMRQAGNLISASTGAFSLCGDDDGWRRIEYALAAADSDEALQSIWVLSSLVAARYPDVRAVIPDDYNYLARVSSAELVPALKLAVAVAGDAGRVTVQLSSTGLVISASGPDGQEYDAEVTATIDGNGRLECIFNGRYLLQAVQAVATDEVTLRLLDAKRPAVITAASEERGRHVIMPMTT
ncbi:MAG: DNA polymerase III subunit beta [Anaerolineae bacterium]|nr:MAG: DNA polymerase III subunit beta [Anaerolineae bacterium]